MTDWLKTQILRKYLEGNTQEQISIELGVSEGAISAYLQALRQADGTLILQHEIAVVCHKNNIPIRYLASNLAFSAALKKLAFDRNQIDLLLRTLDKILVRDGSFSHEMMAKKILEICNYMEANQISLAETHTITGQKNRELNEIKKKIAESKKIFYDTEQSRIDALRKRRITAAKLRTFSRYERAFEEAQIDFRNLKKFANVLSTIRELDSNPKIIIEEMKKTDGLESRKHSIEKECDELEKNLENYKKEQDYHEKYRGSYSLAIDLVNGALAGGVSVGEISNLFNTIVNNRDHFSLTELQTDIDTYGGIKSAIFKIKRDLQKLTAEKESLVASGQIFDFG